MRLLDEMFHVVSHGHTKTVLRMDPGHPIYGLHFPGQPITPGVCIVQMLAELLERHTGCQLELSKIVNLKFLHTLSPNPTSSDFNLITVDFASLTSDGNTVHAKGTIGAEGSVATKFSLIFTRK